MNYELTAVWAPQQKTNLGKPEILIGAPFSNNLVISRLF